jgi:mono/diheme cytochrome c family protein
MKYFVLAALVFAASGAVSSASAQATDAKAVYDANCKKCHGAEGIPSKAMVTRSPKLAPFNAAFFAKRSEDSLVKVIANGKAKMPAYKTKRTPAEISAVAKYIRTFATKAK